VTAEKSCHGFLRGVNADFLERTFFGGEKSPMEVSDFRRLSRNRNEFRVVYGKLISIDPET